MKSSQSKYFLEKLKSIPQEVRNYNRLSMEIAAIIDDTLKVKGWSQKKLANLLNKKESEISKFLSGKHNFTIKTISKLESVLDTKLVQTKFDNKRPIIFKYNATAVRRSTISLGNKSYIQVFSHPKLGFISSKYFPKALQNKNIFNASSDVKELSGTSVDPSGELILQQEFF